MEDAPGNASDQRSRAQTIALGLIMLVGAVYAARGLWTLYQGEYWSASRNAPPVLYTGAKAQWNSLASLMTGAGVAAAAMTGLSTRPRAWWAIAILCGVATLVCYAMTFAVRA